MRLKETHDLFLFWNDLRRGSVAPDICDLGTAPKGSIPADGFVLDFDPKNEFPFRLSTARLDALTGIDLQGYPFVDLWRAKEAENMPALLLDVVYAGCPVVAEVAAGPPGEFPVEIELLLLPLYDRGRARARILGLAAYAVDPAWLGRRSIRHLTMRRIRIIRDTDASRAFGDPPNERQLFPRKEPAPPRSGEQRGHLRVYSGGRLDEARARIRA